MTAAAELSIQRDATAMIHAALRRDHKALAHLIDTTPTEHLPALAVACAIFAAGMCRDLNEMHPELDYATGLRIVAMDLAKDADPA
jgi:hypothetical protein